MFKTGYLNGLRALAAFSVLTAHCMIWSGWPGFGLPHVPESGAGEPGAAAKMAVDLFMILSGFLMVLNVHQRSATEPMSKLNSWFIFYIRRFFRIAPTYYVSIIVAVLLAGPIIEGLDTLSHRIPWMDKINYNANGIKYTIENILLHVTFVFGLFPVWVDAVTLPDWSLSLEMQFYLVFPALMLLSNRFGMLKVCALLVPICMFATAMWRLNFPEPSLLLFKLPVFCVGMLLCHATIVSARSERFVLRLAAVALTLTQFQFYGRGTIGIMAVAAFIAVLTVEARGGVFATLQQRILGILDNRITQLWSDMAYSVYLFHGFFIAIIGGALFHSPTFVAFNPHARTAILFVAVLIGTIVVSTFVHRVIEMPGIKAGRRVISRLGSATLEKRVASA
jgi:peptidoglycan/LPS O-acetylase OafA/YrhL